MPVSILNPDEVIGQTYKDAIQQICQGADLLLQVCGKDTESTPYQDSGENQHRVTAGAVSVQIAHRVWQDVRSGATYAQQRQDQRGMQSTRPPGMSPVLAASFPLPPGITSAQVQELADKVREGLESKFAAVLTPDVGENDDSDDADLTRLIEEAIHALEPGRAKEVLRKLTEAMAKKSAEPAKNDLADAEGY
jgi:hypothetical protein